MGRCAPCPVCSQASSRAHPWSLRSFPPSELSESVAGRSAAGQLGRHSGGTGLLLAGQARAADEIDTGAYSLIVATGGCPLDGPGALPRRAPPRVARRAPPAAPAWGRSQRPTVATAGRSGHAAAGTTAAPPRTTAAAPSGSRSRPGARRTAHRRPGGAAGHRARRPGRGRTSGGTRCRSRRR